MTDQTIDVGSESTAVVAGRDVKIINDLAGVANIIELFNDNNKVMMEKVADEKSRENIALFQEQIYTDFQEDLEQLKLEKLGDPDVQYTFNEALHGAARKGDKIDLKLLSSLLKQRLKDNDDEMEFYIKQAVQSAKETPSRLTSSLSVIFILRSCMMKHKLQSENYQNVSMIAKGLNDIVFSSGREFKKTEMMILVSRGLLYEKTNLLGIRTWGDRFDFYRPFEELKKELNISDDADVVDVESLYNNFGSNGLNDYGLTVTGQIIALSILGRYGTFPDGIEDFII